MIGMRFVLANGFLFIAISGILFYQYFFQSPFPAAVPSLNPNAIAAAAQLRSPAATPAALPLPLPTKPLTGKKMVDRDWKFSLTCKNSDQVVNRTNPESADSIILSLKKCDKEFHTEFPSQIVIENESNGFTASLFALNSAQSKTDSIPLRKGKNLIVIKYQFAKSKKSTPVDIVEKLSIER